MNTLLRLCAKPLVLAATLLVGGIAASPLPAPTPSVAPVNASVLTRAKSWLLALQRGSIDRTQLTPQMNALLTDASLKTFAGEIGPFGAPTLFQQTSIVHRGGNTGYIYSVTFANGTQAVMVFALDDATSKVSGLRLTPSP